jgi:hypothetical protein
VLRVRSDVLRVPDVRRVSVRGRRHVLVALVPARGGFGE